MLQYVAVCCSVLHVCSFRSIAGGMYKFSKVSSLLNLLYNRTVKLSSENFADGRRDDAEFMARI